MLVDCTHCNLPLKKSLTKYLHREEFKSCPKCSSTHGTQDVYFNSPTFFGTTEARESDTNPSGVQSYCESCRPPAEKEKPSSVFQEGVTCANFPLI
jgi:hypothetical protein